MANEWEVSTSMWIYEKKLQYPVKVSKCNPMLAKFLIEPDNMGLFDTATGYVPPIKGVTANDWEMMNNPLIARLLDERSAARPWTSWPGKSGAQIDQVIVSMRDRICVDFQDVATVIAETEAEINRMLNE